MKRVCAELPRTPDWNSSQEVTVLGSVAMVATPGHRKTQKISSLEAGSAASAILKPGSSQEAQEGSKRGIPCGPTTCEERGETATRRWKVPKPLLETRETRNFL
jgi:hypothetical protein